MASSYSTDLKLELMVTGENSGTWGDKTNTNLNLLQQAIAGYQAIAITSTNTTLAMSNATISDARNAVIKFTGTIAANTTVFVDSGIEKTYIIENGTSGAFTLALNQVGGNSVIFGASDKTSKIVYLDGTNANDLGVVNLTAPQTLTNKTLTTPTLTSPIIDVIDDSNGNEEIKFTTTASAVNELTVANAATGNAPEISSTGDDTNIDIKITPKGTGKVVLDGIKYPNADGSSGQVLSTDGSGNLSFTTIESSPTNLQSSFVLAANKSTTIRNAVSISKATGEVGAYPVLNTFPVSTIQTITTTNTSFYRSLDGTHGVLYTSNAVGSGLPGVVYFSGVYTPHDGTPVIGNNSVSVSVPASTIDSFNRALVLLDVKPFTSQHFLCCVGGYSGDENGGAGMNVLVVNTSANITSYTQISNSGFYRTEAPTASLINNTIAVYTARQASDRSIVAISNNLTTLTKTAELDSANFASRNGNLQTFGYGSNGLLFYPTGSTVFFQTVNATATTLTTVSSQSINFHSTVSTWYKTGQLRWLADYSNITTGIRSYTVFDVNATTMAFTSVSTTTVLFTGIVNFIGSVADQVDASTNTTTAILSNGASLFKKINTIGLSTNGQILGFGAQIAMSPDVDIARSFLNTNNSTQSVVAFINTSLQYRTYQINAASTDSFNYVGIASANDTTSPANVATNGVVGGYSGLSIGQQLYADLTNGNVTTTIGDINVGYALTSTQVLIKGVNL
jgi:hypothetical protein